jgi:hypothetical protein
MARTPATITQADLARVIRAAKQTGATSVEVCVGEQAKIIIRLGPHAAEAISQDIVIL